MLSSGQFVALLYGVASVYLFESGNSRDTLRMLPLTDNEPHYHFTTDTHTWDEAVNYCKKFGGGKLVEFQTKKELRNAAAYVMENTEGGDFWVGGVYKGNKWEWLSGGKVNESMADWLTPQKTFAKDSRLGIDILDRFTVKWEAPFKNDKKKVLCQHLKEEDRGLLSIFLKLRVPTI